MSNKIEIGKKGIDSGYILAPYIIQTSTPQVVEVFGRNKKRMKKISNIFDLRLNIDIFSPKKSIASRYGSIKINNTYYTGTGNI